MFQAAQKEQESTKKHGRKPGKKPTDDTGKQKSPQKQQQKVGNKRKRVQKGQVFYDDDNEEEKERETLSKKQRGQKINVFILSAFVNLSFFFLLFCFCCSQ